MMHEEILGDTTDCKGFFGAVCGGVFPEWRHQVRVTWATPWNLRLSTQWRFIQGTKLDTNSSNPDLSNGKIDPFDAKMPDVSYFDLSGLWDVHPGVTIRAGVNNIFDRDPPILKQGIPGTGSPNAYPLYDLLGREVFAGATIKF